MIVLKFLLAFAFKIPLLLLTALPAAVIVPIFTRWQTPELGLYTWGGWWGTFDNPPQGDRGYVSRRAPYPNEFDGWRGYINRAVWMLRNPLYGYTKFTGIDYDSDDILSIKGNPDISDKYKIAGWMHASLRDVSGKLKGFEWYSVTPWSKTRNLRIRLGWKIKTDKMQERGWARHVFTINPLDGYGDD